MTIEEIKRLISGDETRALELKKTTGEMKDAMHSACAMLNTDGGWLIFGVAPKSLKLQGQQVTDATRQEIANALTGLEPSVDIKVESVNVPDAKNGEQLIAMHFNGWTWGRHPYTYRGCPYYKPESITKVMPQSMYDERVLESAPDKYSWENRIADVEIADLDEKRIKEAVRLGVDSGRLPSTAIGAPKGEILAKLDLLKDGKPKNAAVMLFGKTANGYPQLLVRMARFRGTDKNSFIDNQRAKGNFFDLMDAGMAFLFKHLSLSGVIKGLKREERLEVPVSALREGLTNAYCHRMFDNPGESVSIGIYDDRVEIINPGRFPNGITPETIMQTHESRPRNPLIADVLYLSTYLESWGSGVRRMVEACREEGLEDPQYSVESGSIKLVFKRGQKSGKGESERFTQLLTGLSERQRQIVSAIRNNRRWTLDRIAKELGLSKSTVSREMKLIKKTVKLSWNGSARDGAWIIENMTGDNGDDNDDDNE